MATPRSNVVRLRLTDLEKADWQKAAGGARKLSEWIRSVCNAEAARLRGGVAEPVDAEGLYPSAPRERAGANPAIPTEPVPNTKPLIVEAAIAASTSTGGGEEKPEEASESSTQMPVARPSANTGLSSPAVCPRWMHHRPGTYCGACKRVVK